MINFTDGTSMDFSGPYRVAVLKDGLYVVGEGGVCIRVADFAQGKKVIDDLRQADLDRPIEGGD